jgi:hypothetical protein
VTTPEVVLWAIVLAVGVPSSWWNPTAGALVLCWILGEAIYTITGDNLPTTYYLFGDAVVLMVIFAKAEHRWPLTSSWFRLKSILRDAVCMDRLVLIIFPVMWTLYAVPLHPFYKWWSLYVLVIAQFAAAGWEAIFPHPCDHAKIGDRNDMRLMRTAANDTA